MKTRYKITIEEVREEVTTIAKEWKKGAGDGPEDFGYTPEVETKKTVRREVYMQNTESLDLVAVIKAINNIDSKQGRDIPGPPNPPKGVDGRKTA